VDPSVIPDMLASLLADMDNFMKLVHGMIYPGALGGVPLFGGMGALQIIVVSLLAGVGAMHFVQTLAEWIKTRDFEVRHILEIFKIMAFVACMLAVSRWSLVDITKGNLTTGAVGGVSYQSISAQVTGGQAQAIAALQSLDIIQAYEDALQESVADRNKSVLEAIAKEDAQVATMLAARDGAAANQGKPTGIFDSIMTAMDKGKELLAAAIEITKIAAQYGNSGTTMAVSSLEMLLQILGNVIAYAFYKVMIWITYFFFTLMVLRAIVVFAVYLKIAIFLGLIFVPPAVGLAYFLPMRGIAINLIKQVAVLMMLSTLFGASYKAVFSQSNLEYAVSLSLKDGIAGNIAEMSKNDLKPTEYEKLALRLDTLVENITKTPASATTKGTLAYWATLNVAAIRNVFLALARGVMIMGMMVVILGKVYDLVSGAVDGAYDPTDLMRQQALEGQNAMRG